MKIIRDNLSGKAITNLLETHINEMQATSPPESKHALDINGLRESKALFWSVWDHENLAGCGAFIELDSTHAELKSMRTASNYKGRGVASRLLIHLINEAKKLGYTRLSLETGAMDYFKPARKLYLKHGFEYTAPFSDYTNDPNSIFLTKELFR